ncbi:hydroxymethylbilane synthase [Campylobacter troglodytis]|uniref:hydroxymethylbilane synthase n=1 Tax=Campylobacter troglodytis TaxID=654363 RepID=UPI00115B1F7B|nr:hydroxymethylbilane synthase [Campylobacter troglodytis]TQR60552.1 hydroxymethylbilane synthase [Campylobacter troglodytis]
MQKLVIATRKSALALWQSEFVKALLLKNHANLELILQGFSTRGDKILDTPLAKIGGKGLFTKELESAMLRGDAHLAVHSLKDLPSFFPKGLVLAAVCKREEPNDSLLSEKFKDLSSLPRGAKVGTTSLRRKMQLLRKRPDLNIISLRGNINSRLEKLKKGEFDAIVLAYAGLKRLKLDKAVNFLQKFSLDEMIPAASQGILGIESVENAEILKLLACLDDENSRIMSKIERDFIKELEGGCQVPIGINAEIVGDSIKIRAILGLSDGSELLQETQTLPLNSCENAGKNLANEFIKRGAKELLKRAESMV